MANNKIHLKDLPKLGFQVHNAVSTDEIWMIDKEFDRYDFEVLLPTLGGKLQRPYVWPEGMASNLVMSILLSKPIPPMCLNVNNDTGKVEVIDGKQRLLSAIKFYRNEIPMFLPKNIEGIDRCYYKDLDEDLQLKFRQFSFTCYMHYEHERSPYTILTDEQKVDWFLYINTTQVPQEDHIYDLWKLIHPLKKS